MTEGAWVPEQLGAHSCGQLTSRLIHEETEISLQSKLILIKSIIYFLLKYKLLKIKLNKIYLVGKDRQTE